MIATQPAILPAGQTALGAANRLALIGLRRRLPAVLLRQHLPQIGDIGGGLLRRQVGAGNAFGLRKPSLLHP
jgi:hypothetical protein